MTSTTSAIWPIFSVSLRIDARFDRLGQPLPDSYYDREILAIAEDGRRVAYATRAGLVRIYDVDKGGSGYRSDLVTTLAGRVVVSFTGNLRDAVILPAGGVAALGSNGDYEGKTLVQVVQPQSGARTYTDKEAANAIIDFGLSREGSNLNQAHSYGLEPRTQIYQGATFLLASKTVSPDTNAVLLLWNRARKNQGKDKSWSIGGQGLIEIRATSDDRVLQRFENCALRRFGNARRAGCADLVERQQTVGAG